MRANEEGSRGWCARQDTHQLTLEWRDGSRESVHATGGETVLDAAEQTGANLPFGCLIGACTTCTGRVLEGMVEHGRPPRGLKPRHIDGGYALLCIAHPRADCRIEVGTDVQSELVSNTWK